MTMHITPLQIEQNKNSQQLIFEDRQNLLIDQSNQKLTKQDIRNIQPNQPDSYNQRANVMIDGYYQSMQTPKQPRVNQAGGAFNFLGEQYKNAKQEHHNSIDDDVINSINEQLVSPQSKAQQWGNNSIYKMFKNRTTAYNQGNGKSNSKRDSSEFDSDRTDNDTANINEIPQRSFNLSKNIQSIELSNIHKSKITNELQQQHYNNSDDEQDQSHQEKVNTKKIRKKEGDQSDDDDDDNDEEEEDYYQTLNLPQKGVSWNKSFLDGTIESTKIKSMSSNKSLSSFLKEIDEEADKSNSQQLKEIGEIESEINNESSVQQKFIRAPGKRNLSYAHPTNTSLNFGIGSSSIPSSSQSQNNANQRYSFQADIQSGKGFSKSEANLQQVALSGNQQRSSLQIGATPQSATIPENKQTQDKILNVLKNAKVRYFFQQCRFNLSTISRRAQLEKKHYKAISDKSAVGEEGDGEDQEELKASDTIKRQLKLYLVCLLEVMPIVSPSSLFKTIWDVSQMIIQIYTFWIIPLNIATGLSLFHLVGDPFSHIIIPIILLLDLLVAMNTGYNKNGVTVQDKEKILDHYYSEGGLLFDVIALLSVICLAFRHDHVTETLENYDDPSSYFLIIYFLKYFQFGRIAKKVEDRLDLSSKKKNALALFNLFSNVLLISHFFACIWIFIGRYQQLTKGDSYLNKRNIYYTDWYTWYIQTIYYVVVTMTTVGYGDIVPATSFEFIVSVLIMLFACGIFAYNVNAIGAILDEFYRQKRIIDEKMAVINAYMSRHNINLNLRYQIRDFLENFWNECAEQHEDLETLIISDLPKYLKESLIDEVNHVILKKSPIFRKNFSHNVCKRLTHILKEVHFPPNQLICHKDMMDDGSIYFIRNGTVQVTYNQVSQQYQPPNQQQNQTSNISNNPLSILSSSPQSSFLNPNNQNNNNNNNNNNNTSTNQLQIQTPFSQSFFFLKKDDSFGEISFFTGQVRNATIKAVDFTTLVKIDRQEFISLLQSSPADYEKFCLIRDRIIHSKLYHNIGIKCYACSRQDHLMDKCPAIHAAPKKYLTIKKYLYSPQPERIQYKRNMRDKFSTLRDIYLLKQAAKELYPDGIFDYESGDQLESTDSSGSGSSGSNSQSDSNSEKRSRSSSVQSFKSKKSILKNQQQYTSNSPRNQDHHKLSHFIKFSEKKKGNNQSRSGSSSSSSSSSSEKSGSQNDSDSSGSKKIKNKQKSQSSNQKSDNKQITFYQNNNKILNQISETRQEEDLSDAHSDSSSSSVKLNSYKKLPTNKSLSMTKKSQFQQQKNNKTKKDTSNLNESHLYQQQNTYKENKERSNSKSKNENISSQYVKHQKGVQSSFSSKSSSLLLQTGNNDPFNLSQQNRGSLIKQQTAGKQTQKPALNQESSSPEVQNQVVLFQLIQKLADKFLHEENNQVGNDVKDSIQDSSTIFDSSSDTYKNYQVYYPKHNQSVIIQKYNDLTTKQNQSAFFMAFQVSKKQDQTEADSPTKGQRGRTSVFLKFNPRFSVAPPGLR